MRLYVHIPFCRSKCWYCSFNSSDKNESYFKAYLHALKEQFYWLKSRYDFSPPESLYIGGGTPSFYPKSLLAELVGFIKEEIAFDTSMEFTIEANPIDVTDEWLLFAKELGATRLSIGVQSFDDRILRLLSRAHNADMAESAVSRAIGVFGRDAVSIDIIYGIPSQDIADIERDINKAVQFGVGHISAYMLTLSEDKAETRAMEIDDEFQSEAFVFIHNRLRENGYDWYELSNFARRGIESRHNIGYWMGDEYIGLGSGAWSFMNGRRFSWSEKIEEYIESAGDVPCHEIKVENVKLEIELLKLRTRFGASYSIIAGSQRQKEYVDFLIDKGLMLKSGDNCVLSLNGLLFADEIAGGLL